MITDSNKLTTKGIEYIRYTYTFKDSYAKGFGAFYQLLEVSKPDYYLPKTVRIEKDLKRSKAQKIEDRLFLGGKIVKGLSTGLRLIEEGKYYGDIPYKTTKSFLLVQLSKENNTLVIDSFRGFYPKPSREYIINSHQFKF